MLPSLQTTNQQQKGTMNKLTIGSEEWVDPEGFRMLSQAITPEVTLAVEDYRKLFGYYATAYGAREGGTTRRKAAVQAQDQAIARAIEDGLSPEQIFERVGDDPVWMSNNFAVKISGLYGGKAKRARKHLLSVLKTNHKAIVAYLEGLDDSNPDTAIALDFIKTLDPDIVAFYKEQERLEQEEE